MMTTLLGGDESVIICDSPNSLPNPLSIIRTKSTTNTECRDSSQSHCKIKSFIGSVYESPLDHFKRNLTGKRKANENDIFMVSSPIAKRRKIIARTDVCGENVDQSVVILNDSNVSTIIDIGTSDNETNDVEISDHSTRVKTTNKNNKSSSSSESVKNRRSKRLADKGTAIKIMKNNGRIVDKTASIAGCEAEDIEVVWVSDKNSKRNDSATKRKKAQPFFLDTSETFRNFSMLAARSTKKLIKRLDNSSRKKMKKNQQLQPFRGTLVARTQDLEQDRAQDHAQDLPRKKKPLSKRRLREIIIDGNNVAMGHKQGTGFSEEGLKIVIDYFKERGHKVMAFLPQSVRKQNRKLLESLHLSGELVFTPSRKIGGKNITPYDDRFILEYATKCNGIVVSSDQYRDLWKEKPEWRDTIENRLLAPTFVGNYLMFPEDPLGRTGPKLEEFLRH